MGHAPPWAPLVGCSASNCSGAQIAQLALLDWGGGYCNLNTHAGLAYISMVYTYHTYHIYTPAGLVYISYIKDTPLQGSYAYRPMHSRAPCALHAKLDALHHSITPALHEKSFSLSHTHTLCNACRQSWMPCTRPSHQLGAAQRCWLM